MKFQSENLIKEIFKLSSKVSKRPTFSCNGYRKTASRSFSI